MEPSVEDRAAAVRAERWCPLLGGDERAAVLEIVLAIAGELETRPRDYHFGRAHDLALADGDAGIALLLAELPGHRAAAERRITRAIDGIAPDVALDASLHVGFTGIAWTWQRIMTSGDGDGAGAGDRDDDHHHNGVGIDGRISIDDGDGVGVGDHDDDPLAAVDHVVLELLRTRDAQLAPGLLFGLAGLAIYALDRETEVADTCLAAIVDRLLATAEPGGAGGLRWRLPPPPHTPYVERFSDGFYDLGVDVGAAGIVAAGSRIAARGVAPTGARELVAGAARWMVAQETSRGIPSKLGVTGDAIHAFGWCKGELGMAVALLRAASELGEPDHLDRAIALGRRAALIDPAGCDEAAFHLGAAGALHAFNRLYQATDVPLFREAALRWLARLLALRRPTAGIAGFTLAGGETRHGLVHGAAGIGLALLATTTERAPTWDRVLGA